MALYRNNTSGFLQEFASNPGAGFTAVSAQPTDTLANRVLWWRSADLGGISSAWHPSLQGGTEVAKPPGTAGSGVNIMAYRYSSFEEPDGLPGMVLTNMTATRNSGGYNGTYRLTLVATAGNGTAYLTPLSNTYNIKLTQNLRWIVSLYVKPGTSGAKAFNVLVKTSGAGTVYTLPMTTGDTVGVWTRVYASLDLRADTSANAMLGIQIVTNGVQIDVDAILIEEWVGDTLAPSAYNAPLSVIDGSQIVNGSISGTEIAAATITGAKIAAATITGTQIANATVTGTNIGSLTVTASNIANLTITASQIANATITGAKIAGSTITDANIVGGAITGASIANATISGAKIASATITGANIASATITDANIANATISSAKIASINADTITAGTLSVDRISANSINGIKIGTGSNGVDTANLVSNAVTTVTAGYSDSYSTISNGSIIFSATLPANANRGTVIVLLAGGFYNLDVMGNVVETAVYRAGSRVHSIMTLIAAGVGAQGTASVMYVDTSLYTGSITFDVRLTSGASAQWRGSGVVLEVKR